MKYLRIYKTLLALNAQSLTAYRANFINSLISSVLWGSITFISILLLTSKVSSLNGWTVNQLLILTGAYNIVAGSFHTLFSRNFERFARLMHMGEFDTLLLKPIDSQLSISFWLANYTGLVRVIVGIIVILSILRFQAEQVFIFPLFLLVCIVGVSVMYCVWFLVSTLLIKFTNLSNLVDVLYLTNGFARYPLDIYKNLGAVTFSVIIPLAVMVTVPAKLLTHKSTFTDILLLIGTAVFLLVLTRFTWKFALRFYTSASG